ncbi:hypothetical protein ABFT23_19145 [Nocardioides sp. C4-1]|uniref:YxiG-like protein n=1 Tax=Nocardioides sp. C4-1 TaxID=3151851 RepID=UPI003265DE84
MDRAGIIAAFADVFDEALVFHGYTPQLRDYDLYVYVHAPTGSGRDPVHMRYRFTHCVVAEARTAIAPEIWRRSLDERLLDHRAALEADLDGYVWGVEWQVLYPGLTLLDRSDDAERWAAEVGITFHEAQVATNGHDLRLVFSDLVVAEVEPRHVPFRVSD